MLKRRNIGGDALAFPWVIVRVQMRQLSASILVLQAQDVFGNATESE